MADQPLPSGKLPPSLLREFLALSPPLPTEVIVPPAIGEDACVIQVKNGALVAATDPVTLTGQGIGAHAVVINANDVAVTGVRPRWFLASLLLPLGTTVPQVRRVFVEMNHALAQIGATLVGGHTEITESVTQPVIVGQMLGLREDGRFVSTGGMAEGDVVLQLGPAPIEGAAVLVAEVADRLSNISQQLLNSAREALIDPGISVVEPALRAADLGASALHDPTEGGLSAGLYELAEASNLMLEVSADAILWFEPGVTICSALDIDPWGTLASGTLLAAFPAASVARAQTAVQAEGYEVRAIAKARAGSGVRRTDGFPFPRYDRDELLRVLIS